MGLLSTLEQRNQGPLDDFWYRPAWFGGRSSKEATPEQALSVSAWFNAITIIAGTMASLPLKLYRRDGDDRVPARDDPRYRLMYRRPTPWHTAFEWREMEQGHLLVRGNGFNRMIRDRTRRVVALEPIHPGRVTIETKAGRLVYRVQRTTGPQDIAAEDMLHLRGMGGDGVQGYSVAALARRSLGYSLALEEHGSELMGNKARPGGVLATEQVLKKETKDYLADHWDEMYTGGGIGRTAVLDAGLSWQQVGFSAEDAQFLESRKFQVNEVARWTNLPPHFLKDLERATFSNIEQQSLEFVVHTIRPWAERWEQRLNESLLDEGERDELFFKFSVDALLRGDSEARAGFYKALFEMGALSPNEIRRFEEMNSVEGGDQRFVQLNLVPLDQASDPMGALDGAMDRALAGVTEPRALPAGDEDRAMEVREKRSLRQRQRLMETYQRLFTDGAGRLVRREVNDLRRLLDAVDDGDVDEFLRRMDIFAEGLPAAVRAIMGPLVAAYVDLVADAAAEEVEMEELDGARVSAWRASYVDALAQGHTSETTGRIRDTMTEAEGDPFGNARGMLDRWEENRASAIGLREAVTAAGGIAVTVYAMANRGAVWRNTGERTCPYCRMLNGRKVEPGGRFLNEGDTLDPGDGTEPLTVGRGVGHPQAHGGCDCTVSAW